MNREVITMCPLSDVKSFHRKFGLPMPDVPTWPSSWEDFSFRMNFIKEELDELVAAYINHDMVEFADACADLIYVIAGTMVWYGLHDDYINTHLGERFSDPPAFSPKLGPHLAREGARVYESILECYYMQMAKADRAGDFIAPLSRAFNAVRVIARAAYLPLDRVWYEVQRSNMEKVLSQGTNRHRLDVVKPTGWNPPQIEIILNQAGWRRDVADS